MSDVSVKRSSVASWSVEIAGEYQGDVHRFTRGGRILFCHDLWQQRGATFATLEKAVSDLVRRAA